VAGEERPVEQLREAIARLTGDIESGFVQIDNLRHVLEDLHHVLSVERWWRRVLVGFVAVVLVSVGSWMSWDRQSDCDRSVRARAAAIDAVVQSFDTTWNEVASSQDGKAELLAKIRADQERIRPKRDCAWPV